MIFKLNKAVKKIKKITETTHIVDGSGESINQIITYQQIRDERENVLMDASWQSNGMLENKSEYEYDTANNVIAQKIYLDEENVSEYWTYQYDEAGKLNNKAVEYADGSHSYYNKTIAENGAINWEIKDEDNEYEGKEIRVYNDKDLLLSSIDIDDEGSETLRKEFVYDENQLLIEQSIYEYEELLSREVMKYDEHGNLAHSISLSPGGNKISETKYSYTEDNKIESYDYNNEVRTSYTYDEKGREIEIKRTNLQTELNMGLTQFKYNENGQLTERLIYEMGAQFEMEPGVVSRSSSVHQKVVFSYEFFS